MQALLGQPLFRMPRESSVADRIRFGHKLLVDLAGGDLGYDPSAWHEHLRATDAGAYRWSNRHLGFPGEIAAALADPEWQAAVASLRSERRAEPGAAPDRQAP
jgi:hypothetical protein